jgi:hypothetical protein
MLPVKIDATAMWTLGSDRQSIRLTLPPLPVASLPKPLRVALHFEATTVDEMIDRLTVLRAQMLPAPPRPSSRN